MEYTKCKVVQVTECNICSRHNAINNVTHVHNLFAISSVRFVQYCLNDSHSHTLELSLWPLQNKNKWVERRGEKGGGNK